MDELDEIRKRLDHLEYDDMKELRSDIVNMKQDMTKSNVLLEQNIKSSLRLTDTLDQVQNTMIQLTDSMRNNNDATNSLSKKVSKLEEKIDYVEDSTKFSISDWFKKNWVNLIILIGVMAYIVLGQYIKF